MLICILNLYFKIRRDVRFSANMQRAMATEAEETREARAEIVDINT